MDSYTQTELDALAAVTEAAPAGPWQEFAESGEYWLAQVEANGEPGGTLIGDTARDMIPQEVIDFICAARTAMPRLLSEIVRLRQVARRYLVTQRGWDDEAGDYRYQCRDCSSEGIGWDGVAHEDWCALNNDYAVAK